MKEKYFDGFCNSFLLAAIERGMAKFECTADEYLEHILEQAHEGDRASQTITGLLLRQDGKPEGTWSLWLSKAVDIHVPDDLMLVYSLYKYCVSDSGTGSESCFGDSSFNEASVYVYKCVKNGIEFSESLQTSMIEDFVKHYPYNKLRYRSVKVDRDGSDAEVAKRIYFAMVENLSKILDGETLDIEDISHEDDNKQSSGKHLLEALAKKFPTDSENKFYSTPSIPPKKIGNFLEKSGYQTDLEDIIFYFDDTVFGKGDQGVIVDFNNIVIKEQFSDAKIIPLSEIQSVEIAGIISKKIQLIKHNGSKEAITLTQSNKGAKLLHDALVQLVALKNVD